MFLKLSTIRTTAPAVPIISLLDAKIHVRRDDSDDDAYITSLIAVVEARVDGTDGILGRMLIDQSWQETASGFPAGDCFLLDLMPVTSIDSVQYFDRDNVLQTFAATNFRSHNGISGAYIKLHSDASWPSTYDRDDAVKITYSGGYGSSAVELPAPIVQASKLLLGTYYENRESVIIGTISSSLPMAVNMLLRPYIRSHF